MKYLLLLLLLATSLLAQEVIVTPEILDTPFVEWDWNLTSLLVFAMFFGRVFSYAKKNGGLKGIFGGLWNGALLGENEKKK